MSLASAHTSSARCVIFSSNRIIDESFDELLSQLSFNISSFLFSFFFFQFLSTALLHTVLLDSAVIPLVRATAGRCPLSSVHSSPLVQHTKAANSSSQCARCTQDPTGSSLPRVYRATHQVRVGESAGNPSDRSFTKLGAVLQKSDLALL